MSHNSHTRPAYIWAYGETVYVAVWSTHNLGPMSLNGKLNDDRDDYPRDKSKVKVPIYVNGEELTTPEVNGNKDDARWAVYKFNLLELSIPEDGKLPFYIQGIGGGHDVGGYIIVDVPKKDIIGSKVWVGGIDRPAVTLQLLRQVKNADGSLSEPVIVRTKIVDGSEEPAWHHTWEGMPVYNPYGKEYYYSIDEEIVPQGYEKTVDGLTVINIYVPRGKITIAKEVLNYNEKCAGQIFDIFIKGPDEKEWTVTLGHNEFKTIEGLEMGIYTISEIVPMNYETVGISNEIQVEITEMDLEKEVTIRNRYINDGWFWDDDTRVNSFTVIVTNPIEERNTEGTRDEDFPLKLIKDVILPPEELLEEEFYTEENM